IVNKGFFSTPVIQSAAKNLFFLLSFRTQRSAVKNLLLLLSFRTKRSVVKNLLLQRKRFPAYRQAGSFLGITIITQRRICCSLLSFRTKRSVVKNLCQGLNPESRIPNLSAEGRS